MPSGFLYTIILKLKSPDYLTQQRPLEIRKYNMYIDQHPWNTYVESNPIQSIYTHDAKNPSSHSIRQVKPKAAIHSFIQSFSSFPTTQGSDITITSKIPKNQPHI